MKFFTYAVLVILFLDLQYLTAQCATSADIYAFNYDGRTYEVVKLAKSWSDAVACAVERGGKLAEIDDAAENTEIFNQLSSASAGIDKTKTVPNDGGGASYVWIGGNDISTEGTWIWDGDNTGTFTQFWDSNGTDTDTGSPIGGLYNNWGTTSGTKNEPDNYSTGQDGLAIALESWPTFLPSGSGYGIPGQWNDIATSESLYFIIEHSTLLSTPEVTQENIFAFIDAKTQQLVVNTDGVSLNEISLYAVTGQQVKTIQANNQNRFNVSGLQSGVYLAEIRTHSGKSIIRKVVK
mgnify:CR=1 FL=1